MQVNAVIPSDLPCLVPLFAGYLEFYGVPKPADDIHGFLLARLQNGDSQLFVARDEQGIAQGFVQLYPLFSSLSLAPAWLLNDLFVSPQVRRLGVGEALMNKAREHAEVTGACGIQLETAKTNDAGQALYERLGYVRDEVYYTYWLGL